MQSRTEFLKTGLVPVTITSELPTDGCPICTDDFENPIALPYKHIFCEKCVVDWLSVPRRNTCPYCRHECFTTTHRELAAPFRTRRNSGGLTRGRRQSTRTARSAIISQEMSRLMTGDFDIFSDDISWDTAGLQRATNSVSRWMNEQPELIGPAFIHKRRLGHDIIVMGNLIRGYARASHRPYSAREVGELRIVIDLLYKSIEARNGRTEDALILTWQLNSDVRLGLIRELGEQRMSTFLAPQGIENPSGDIHRLINYVVFRASEEEAVRRQRRQAIRDEPSLIARVGMRVRYRFRR